MKVLILTAATGGGHNRAADAIQTYLEEQTEFEVETVDTLKAVGRILDKTVCDSYRFMARRVPYLFGSLYKRTNRENRFSQLVPKLNAAFSHSLYYTISESAPDVIITTHPFSTQMVSSLKENGSIDASLVCVMTDYGLHKAWLAPMVDRYVVACEDMVQTLTAVGVPAERIRPYGIPVFDAFFKEEDPWVLRQSLGLDPKLFTITFMAGSFGVSNITELYHALANCGAAMQLLVITGKNQRLYAAFQEELKHHMPVPTKLCYFTTEVHAYMHASDLLVTKPGGLTVSEALASNLPMLLFNAIPGQEGDNAAFLRRHGMGIPIEKKDDIAVIVSDLLKDPARFAEMKASCRAFDKSDGLKNIAELCREMGTERNTRRAYQTVAGY